MIQQTQSFAFFPTWSPYPQGSLYLVYPIMNFLTTAFVSSATPATLRLRGRKVICPARMTATPPSTEDDQSSDSVNTNSRKIPVTNSPPSNRKLVRNKPGATPASPPTPEASKSVYADARAGDMIGGPEVGEGLGPRRGAREKKVTRAAAIQKSQSFADAWAEQNQGRIDVWIIIGLITLLTPLVILAWAIATGVIPTGGLFEE